MAEDSDQRRSKILKKRRPEVQTNEGRWLRGTAAGCSDKRRLEAPMNGGRRFRRNIGLKFLRMKAGGTDEWRPEVLKNWRPEQAGGSKEMAAGSDVRM